MKRRPTDGKKIARFDEVEDETYGIVLAALDALMKAVNAMLLVVNVRIDDDEEAEVYERRLRRAHGMGERGAKAMRDWQELRRREIRSQEEE